MSMQNKPQMVEAVMFFGERGICKQMRYPEFEALLDGVVNMPEFADEEMRAVFVSINPRLLVKSAVFFLLDFDEQGRPDHGWNLPLQHLAERAGRGPDLGAGPIRLACRSQCPVSWHQMHLWDPGLAPGQNDLVLLREAAKGNQLGLLVEDDGAQSVVPERLQVASEDKWYAPDPAKEAADQMAKQMGQEHRAKTAQLIQQQRLRISALTQQHDEELAKFRLAAEQQAQALKKVIDEVRQDLQQQEALNAALKQQLTEQADSFRRSREGMTEQLRVLEQNARNEREALQLQFESELKARIAAEVAHLKEQVAVRDVELAYGSELDTQQQAEIERLRGERDALALRTGDQVLGRLASLGVIFVVYHPGAGHLTIPLQDLARYQENPMAYAAAKCLVSEEQYRQWLVHYQQPKCEARLGSGEPCAIPVDRVDMPSRFISGESNCCSRHRASVLLRTVG